jgi:hypothetical protein
MYITNKIRTDGFGAQYQCIIFTILFAELMGLEFIYTPFGKMEHNYENDVDFILKKENLINLINHYKHQKDIEQDKIIDYEIGYIYKVVEDNLDFCLSSESFKKVKELFYQNVSNKSNEKTLNIHIRRPNKFDIGNYGYTDDGYFLTLIEDIKMNNPDLKKIKIHSQGELSDFTLFKNLDVEFSLNKTIEETFIDLVTSDILVLSKSSFSYTAGLLSDGLVYYQPFWHKPVKNWINK